MKTNILKRFIYLTAILSLFMTSASVSAVPVITDGAIAAGDHGNSTQTLSAFGLDAHTNLTINFDLFIQDSWDGNAGPFAGPDMFGVMLDGAIIFSASFDNFGPTRDESNTETATATGNYNGINNWGAIDRFFDDYAGGFTVAHSASSFDLTFYGLGLQGLHDESWRVSDIDVMSDARVVTSVAEPSVLSLFVVGLLGLAVMRRKS